MEAARTARAEELPRLAELAAAAAAEAAAFRGGELLAGRLHREDPDAVRTWLEGYRTGADRLLLAGTVHDSIVGVGALQVRADPPVGSFDLLYVEPDARGVGLGAAIVEAGVGWLRDAGCSGVDVVALPGARDTKQFLEGAGLVARLIVMHRAI
ncbi:MAG TPA: GNAT family N-acetyltransferase [Acidimicrobiales bacterium]|nr:GNAT family N-acetyltransferase [Acidimicrobiales bacterium]